jgi:hypothetical protein
MKIIPVTPVIPAYGYTFCHLAQGVKHIRHCYVAGVENELNTRIRKEFVYERAVRPLTPGYMGICNQSDSCDIRPCYRDKRDSGVMY